MQADASTDFTKIGYLRLFVEVGANAMSDKIPNNIKTIFFDILFNVPADVVQAIPVKGILNPLVETLPCDINQLLNILAD